jgi:integrase
MSRGKGEGTIYYEAERGRWVGQLDISDGIGGRRRRKVTGKTKSAVAARMRELRDEEKLVRRSSSVTTTGELLTRWLHTAAAAKLGETSSTFTGYRHTVEHHLVPALGSIRLDRLHPEHIDDYFLTKARDGYARSTLIRHRSVLGQGLRWGVKRRHLSWDPASLAELPPEDVFRAARRRQIRTPRALNAEEARRFIAAARERHNGAALVLALCTGLRPGEVTALSWSDLDLSAGRVTVQKAWKGTKEHRHIGEPKTRGSIRTVGIPDHLVDLLRAHRRAQLEARMRSSQWTDDGLDLVFTTKVGTPLDPANLRRLCDEVAATAGVGGVAPYDLRHTATSLLSEAGVRYEELADLLGHVDTRMVERHYRHRLSDSVSVAVGPMGDLLAAAE